MFFGRFYIEMTKPNPNTEITIKYINFLFIKIPFFGYKRNEERIVYLFCYIQNDPIF